MITRATKARFNDPLNITVAKVGSDGHILIISGVARFAETGYGHKLAPDWHGR